MKHPTTAMSVVDALGRLVKITAVNFPFSAIFTHDGYRRDIIG
jgi:hypothetical protein